MAEGALDLNAYRKRVLAPLLERGADDLTDAFALLDLPPQTDDERLIRERMRTVTGLWRKESSPKYKGLAGVLLKQAPAMERTMLDRRARAALRERVLSARAEGGRARYTRLDTAISRLEERFGGVPRSRREGLVALAARDGLSADEVDARLAQHRVLDDGSGSAEALPEAVRRQIRSALRELAALRGDPAGARSLYAFLGVAPTAPADKIRARVEELAARNRQRKHDRELTLVSELLTLSRLHLLDGDRSLYANALVEEVKDDLRQELELVAVVEGSLSAAQSERLIRDAVAQGLDPEAVRRAVAELARELGLALETAAAVDYVVCANCGSVEPEDGRERCRNCGAGLYRDCPHCHARISAGAAVCPSCGTDLRALREAEARVTDADAQLSAGRLVAARRALEAARETAGSLPALAGVQSRLADAERTAQTAWRMAEEAIQARRLVAAEGLLEDLAGRFPDVPGSDGVPPGGRLAQVRATLEEAKGDLSAALGMTGVEAERRLVRVLELVADADAAEEALARIPPQPPGPATAELRDGAIAVSWEPSASAGVEYGVVRVVGPVERPLGRTATTRYQDGGSPAGGLVSYRISSRRAGAESSPSTTPALLVAAEVAHLAVEAREGEVALRWRAPGGGSVWVERTEIGPPEVPKPTRRLRPDDGGYLDTHVKNGTPYSYRVYVEYRDAAGAPVRTPGLTVQARPRARLVGARDLRLASTEPGVVTLAWRPPRLGEIRVVRLREDAGVPSPGARLDTSALAGLGEVIHGDGEAVDEPGVGGISTYLPVTVLDDDAVAGVSARYLGLPDVSDLRADPDALDAGRLVLSWTWPDGCTEAQVAWRKDLPPAGPEDPAAASTQLTNGRYARDGDRVEIPVGPPDGRSLHVAVFPGRRIDNRLMLAPDAGAGGRLLARPARTTTARYEIRRAGWRRRTLRVEIVADGPLPELLLVARAGDAPPASVEAGEIVDRLAARPAESGVPVRHELPVDRVTLPAGLRLFPADPAAGLMLQAPEDEDLVLR